MQIYDPDALDKESDDRLAQAVKEIQAAQARRKPGTPDEKLDQKTFRELRGFDRGW